MKKLIAALLVAALVFTLVGCGQTDPVEAGIIVEKVDGLSKNFIMGADVSSMLSLEDSGVKYYDFNGDEADLLSVLKDGGINYIRVRVWNDPYDSEGNGFGGGNCDVNTAAEIGARAAQYGLKLLVDFHYSDFWADPSKQQAPRAWEDMEDEEKQQAIAEYTTESLRTIKAAGADIAMVQIGNETTNGFCGEKYWLNVTGLMSAAAQAIRAFDKNILIAVHYTNPEQGKYANFAFQLDHFGVDYDIFASSYYSFWHGTLDNLTAQLAEIADTYDKKVMIAETSYAYTVEELDGQGNTIGESLTYDKYYPFTVQGQANAIADVIAAAASLGDRCLGVFYWEPAWITVPAASYEERFELWEKYGSGWASSYATEYDPDDAGVYFGGSACDNQALFDAEGHPLESLNVFKYVYTGAVTDRRVDSVENAYIAVRLRNPVELPETVVAYYNDGSTGEVAVEWEDADLTAMSEGGVAVYTVAGTAEGLPVVCRVSMEEENYVENYSFEGDDVSMWVIDNIGDTDQIDFQNKTTDAHSGSMSLHFWDETSVEFSVEQTVTGLRAGSYQFSISLQGGDAVAPEMYIYAVADGVTYRTDTDVDGWVNWRQPIIEGIACESGEITIGVYIKSAGGWGTMDDFLLNPME